MKYDKFKDVCLLFEPKSLKNEYCKRLIPLISRLK